MNGYRNKWNGKTYRVKETADKKVTLVREDGSEFTIQLSEFLFSYREVKNEAD